MSAPIPVLTNGRNHRRRWKAIGNARRALRYGLAQRKTATKRGFSLERPTGKRGISDRVLGKEHIASARGAHRERKMLNRGSRNPITDRSVRGEAGGESQGLPEAENS